MDPFSRQASIRVPLKARRLGGFFLYSPVRQLAFSFHCRSHIDGGLDGHADVYDGLKQCCRIALASSFATEDALGAALNDKCMSWAKDWEARRPAAHRSRPR